MGGASWPVPEKESTDLLGESLGEVFGLAAKDGESTTEWVASVKDVCDRGLGSTFRPKQGVGLPWIALHCCGLSEEQKAIVKAKSQGKLEYDTTAAALRSCFPSYKAGNPRAKKAIGSLLVEDHEGAEASAASPEDEQFQDVEAFLADHGIHVGDSDTGEVSESDAAEALAVIWKERRKEIQKVNQSKRFGQPRFSSSSSSRSFRVDVEELKRLGPGRKEQVNTKSEASATSSAGLVQFAGAAECCATGVPVESLAAGLTSSPGKGIVDSGCGKTLIGSSTLAAFQDRLKQRNLPSGDVYSAENKFRFGNGALETATQSVRLPVGLNGKYGLIEAAIISGSAPLLLGRPASEKLNVHLDFQNNKIKFLDMGSQDMQ